MTSDDGDPKAFLVLVQKIYTIVAGTLKKGKSSSKTIF
jgi:hypothetical protein